ncbi:MAG: hypothetical protein J7501_00105 [Bdellovibrio sp.]|nr:hypothetical protein [Bdellovibrio sp.]
MDSEFELQLPRQFQQSLIEKKWNSLSTQEFQGNWKLSDQIIQTSQAPVNFKGITIAVKSNLKKPSLADSKALLQLSSQDLSAEIQIAEVSVDTIIEKEVGGMIGKFRIQAKCENVGLKLKSGQGKFGIILKPNVGSTAVGGEVQDVSLSWSPGSWEVGDFTCTGAEGFDVVLRDEVQKISNDSDSFVNPQKSTIKEQVAKYLSSYELDLSLPRQLVTARNDISMSMSIDSYTEDENTKAMVARGHIFVTFKNSKTGNAKVLTLSKTAVILNQGAEAGLMVPGEFAKELLNEAYAADSWVHTLSSSQLPGFSTIMNSRFAQMFIWPELMDYSKSAKFRFDLYSNKDPQISGSGMSYNVKLNLISRMQAPKSSGYVNFMYFTMPFSTKLDLAVDNGVMSASFKNTALTLNYQWDPTYVKNYSPSQRFSASTIRDRVVGSISGKTNKFNLPTLPLAEGISLKVKSVKSLSNDDLLLRLNP